MDLANSPSICVVGSSNMDLISYVSHLPKPGETIRGHKFKTGFGGKGANQAVAAAALGAHVVMVCKVGDDFFGKEMINNFKEQKIETDYIFIANDVASGVASINVTGNGTNNIVIVSGANDLLSKDEIQASRPVIKKAKVLLTQLEISLETTMEALQVAKEEGVTTILNTAPAQELPDKIFQLADIISPNETELETLTGLPVTNIEEAKIAARKLLEKGAKMVLVTLGEKGSLLVTPSEEHFEPIEEKVNAIDTTGAGDCFLGTFAYFFARGDPIRSCMRKANKVASISVTREGTQTSFPRRSELPESLFDQ